MDIDKKPVYGASEHYLGEKGQRYFAGQQRTGFLAAAWNKKYFWPYIRSSDKVLDFGCGGGDLLAMLPAQEKIGVEINPAAREYAATLGLQVFPVLEAAPPGPYEVIISSHALEHVPEPLTLLRSLRQFLAADGRFILLLPLDDWRAPAHRVYKQVDVHHHLYNWTPQNLGNLLSEAGFQIQEVKIIRDAMPVRPWLTRLALNYPVLHKMAGAFFGFILRRYQLFAVCQK